MTYKQESPFAVQIELCEGCNLRCGICGLNGIRGKENQYKFMSPATLTAIIKSIVSARWTPRIEFAMHGEPTMHPDYLKMIRLARDLAPNLQIMMTTNGGGILRSPGPAMRIVDIFKAGLNVLALDDYQNVNIVPKIVEAFLMDDKMLNYAVDVLGIAIYDYPRDEKGNPHVRRKITERVLTIVQDISNANTGTHSSINNHAGAGAPKNDSQAGKRCAKPFRELSFRWDGSVAICCNDWRGEYKCGNINSDTLDGIWNGPAMTAARKKLYNGLRDFKPCKGCDAVSYRVGLLPDKLGKAELPLPNAQDEKAIELALSGPPLTPPVLRPWEKK